jgi:putative redox protein
MIAHGEWKGGKTFEGIAENGNSLFFDGDPALTHSPSPMEAVLMALCGCTGIDVVMILEKKRERLEGLKITASAETAKAPPHVFTQIKLTYAVAGLLSRKAVEDAIALSQNKYCPVSQMLKKATPIDYEIVFVSGEPLP